MTLKLIETNPSSIFADTTPYIQRMNYIQNQTCYSEVLEFMYLDYVNNYLTVEKFASDNDLPVDFAYKLIEDCRKGKHREN